MNTIILRRTSSAPLHTLSKLYDNPVGFVSPSVAAVYCYICSRQRVAVNRYRMICLVLALVDGDIQCNVFFSILVDKLANLK